MWAQVRCVAARRESDEQLMDGPGMELQGEVFEGRRAQCEAVDEPWPNFTIPVQSAAVEAERYGLEAPLLREYAVDTMCVGVPVNRGVEVHGAQGRGIDPIEEVQQISVLVWEGGQVGEFEVAEMWQMDL